jgi:hypothetical protein
MFIKLRISKNSSKVTLPKLPEYVRESLELYNKQAIDIFTEFVNCYVTNVLSKYEPENCLPASKLEFSTSWPNESKQGTLVQLLQSETIPHQARSSFSGNIFSSSIIFTSNSFIWKGR